MASEYWILKRGDEYEQMDGRLGPRLNAFRYTLRHAALSRSDCYTPPLRLVHVRIRPRSERLYLAERLAAWEPVVAAAEEMRKRWDERASPAKQQDAQVAVVIACRGVPKEHRV